VAVVPKASGVALPLTTRRLPVPDPVSTTAAAGIGFGGIFLGAKRAGNEQQETGDEAESAGVVSPAATITLALDGPPGFVECYVLLSACDRAGPRRWET
jgi:hypothetical protein